MRFLLIGIYCNKYRQRASESARHSGKLHSHSSPARCPANCYECETSCWHAIKVRDAQCASESTLEIHLPGEEPRPSGLRFASLALQELRRTEEDERSAIAFALGLSGQSFSFARVASGSLPGAHLAVTSPVSVD